MPGLSPGHGRGPDGSPRPPGTKKPWSPSTGERPGKMDQAPEGPWLRRPIFPQVGFQAERNRTGPRQGPGLKKVDGPPGKREPSPRPNPEKSPSAAVRKIKPYPFRQPSNPPSRAQFGRGPLVYREPPHKPGLKSRKLVPEGAPGGVPRCPLGTTNGLGSCSIPTVKPRHFSPLPIWRIRGSALGPPRIQMGPGPPRRWSSCRRAGGKRKKPLALKNRAQKLP